MRNTTTRSEVLIFLISQDALFGRQVREQVQVILPRVQFEIQYFEDGKSILSEVRNSVPDFIVAPVSLLDLSPQDFEEGIQRVAGSVPILFLGESSGASAAAEASHGDSQFLPWPLTEWGKFQATLLGAVPEEIKQRHGLVSRNGSLYQLLIEYGKKFATPIDTASTVGSSELKRLAMVPMGASSDGVCVNNPTGVHSTDPRSSNEVLYRTPKRFWLVEVTMILLVFTASLLAWHYVEERILFYLLLGGGFFLLSGLVFGRFFNPTTPSSEK